MSFRVDTKTLKPLSSCVNIPSRSKSRARPAMSERRLACAGDPSINNCALLLLLVFNSTPSRFPFLLKWDLERLMEMCSFRKVLKVADLSGDSGSKANRNRSMIGTRWGIKCSTTLHLPSSFLNCPRPRPASLKTTEKEIYGDLSLSPKAPEMKTMSERRFQNQTSAFDV